MEGKMVRKDKIIMNVFDHKIKGELPLQNRLTRDVPDQLSGRVSNPPLPNPQHKNHC